MAYTITEIKARITAILAENHSRDIDGIVLQELLIDLVDSLDTYAGGGGSPSGENYYVDSISFDPETNVLTLTRAGGIDPANISQEISPGSSTVYRAAVVALTEGDNTIVFSVALPTGTTYLVKANAYSDTDGADTGFSVSAMTVNGFTVNADEDCSFEYFIIQLQ